VLGQHLLRARLARYIQSASTAARATIFAYQVRDPERYGVVSLTAGKGIAAGKTCPTSFILRRAGFVFLR
jgi:dTDP-glucose pyrophosphorylase